MSKIKEILEKKGPHFNIVAPTTPVLDALNSMHSENLSYLVIMEDNQFLGIMSEREYTLKIKLKGRQSDSTTVKEIMTKDLPVILLQE
jgi:predicted transcriptional regulator